MQEPISVTEYINNINTVLSTVNQKVIGEVSSIETGPTGHVYFSITDEKNSLLRCAIWKQKYKILGIDLKVGEVVIVSGKPQIYALKGRFSVIVDTIEYAGEGKLKKEYEKLKKKFEKEGLFKPERKKKIPYLPIRIGVVTSKGGAVISDFLNNISQHGFKVQLIDSRVEGQQAVLDLYSAVKQFKALPIDVLVIMRGGGSGGTLEFLMPFNNERLVREIANFPVPVIVAIGHDKDVPLVSMVADVAVSTPTAAANLLNKTWDKVIQRLEQMKYKVWNGLQIIIDYCHNIISTTRIITTKLESEIQSQRKNLINQFVDFVKNYDNYISSLRVDISKQWQLRIVPGLEHEIKLQQEKIKNTKSIIFYNDPQRRLEMGYSIVRKNGQVVRKINQLALNDKVDIQVNDGSFNSKIITINKKII